MQIPSTSPNPLEDFVAIARDSSRPCRQFAACKGNEKRWLKGWLNRIDTYKANDEL